MHKNQITCTSVPQCNIPVGCNIYDWLAKQFQTSDLHVVYAFSDNYYSSVATLNEMGAAWVMRCKWTGVLLPGFTFDKLAGCIDKNQICIKLDDPDIKQRLREFRNGIIEEFGLESINEDEWEEKRGTSENRRLVFFHLSVAPVCSWNCSGYHKSLGFLCTYIVPALDHIGYYGLHSDGDRQDLPGKAVLGQDNYRNPMILPAK